MIHWYLRFAVSFVLWAYYRKIDSTGLRNIPKTGPLLIACNHPNSFLDALVVGIFATALTKRRIHFLARSDVFSSPLKRWILGQMNILPLYRLQEGLENLQKNKDTFNQCYEILDGDGMILIFSEGICVQELRLRPLKKGTARIALEYVQGGKKLHIVPMGLNYLKPGVAREELLVDIGVPFDATQFTESYNANAGRAINEFNKELESRMKQNVINLTDKANEEALEQVIDIQRSEGSDIAELVNTANRLAELAAADTAGYQALIDKAKRYSDLLDETGVEDRVVKDHRKSSVFTGLLYPLYWLARAVNTLPISTSRWVARNKVRRAEFYDSVFLGVFMFVTQFHLLFVVLILLFIHPWWALLIAGVLLLTGFLAVTLHDPLRMNRLRKRREKLSAERLSTLRDLRNEIRTVVAR